MTLLRRDDSPQRMASRQHDAAMIYFRRRCLRSGRWQLFPLHQRAAARRAPVRLRVLSQYRVAKRTDPFHEPSLPNLTSPAHELRDVNLSDRPSYFYTRYIRQILPAAMEFLSSHTPQFRLPTAG